MSSVNMVPSNVTHTTQTISVLAELNHQRDLNQKLNEKLTETEKELQELKLALGARDMESSQEIAERAAALVEEILQAQKLREKAVAARLRNADVEREELLTQVKQLEHQLDRMDVTSELSLELSDLQLPHELETEASPVDDIQPPQRCEEQSMAFITKMGRISEKEREIMAQEMQVVLEQRDRALAQTHQFQQALLQFQHTGAGLNNTLLYKKLSVVQQERDTLLARLEQLSEDYEHLQVLYSLQKALLGPDHVPLDRLNNCLQTHENQIQQDDGKNDFLSKENNCFTSQSRTLMAEKADLELKLSKASRSCQENAKKVQDLERLVSVLRKKLRNLGNGDLKD